jgi:hypothetical protein
MTGGYLCNKWQNAFLYFYRIVTFGVILLDLCYYCQKNDVENIHHAQKRLRNDTEY